MYESFFELASRPFLAAPLAERYFPSASAEHARETAARCIDGALGPVVIFGGAGTGKSTLCQAVAGQYDRQFAIAMLASARLCTRRALLQNILFEIGLPYREREEGELRLSLIDHLEPGNGPPNGLLLIVDEAHMLPLRLLEEIRMITNLVRDAQPRVRLVLAGNLSFDERLANPRLESFSQRIAARCYLQAMNREDTCAYIRAQIATVGGESNCVFEEEALHAVFQATDGIPRLVNQVCDHAMMLAAVGRQPLIKVAGVEEAWADLQQLPTPWTPDDGAAPPNPRDILEFGSLDDETCGELDGPDAIAGDAIAGDAIAGDAIAGDAIAGDAIAGDMIAGALNLVSEFDEGDRTEGPECEQAQSGNPESGDPEPVVDHGVQTSDTADPSLRICDDEPISGDSRANVSADADDEWEPDRVPSTGPAGLESRADESPVVARAEDGIDSIEAGLAIVADEDAYEASSTSASQDADEFRPQSTIGPEIELVFHQAHDPFQERFEEEEVIVDPIASIGALQAESVSPAEVPGPQTVRFPQPVSPEESPTTAPSTLAADDPVMPPEPEPAMNAPAERHGECEPAAQSDHQPPHDAQGDEPVSEEQASGEEQAPGDDRDLVELVETATGASPAPAPAVKRRQYRQLFASLRER